MRRRAFLKTGAAIGVGAASVGTATATGTPDSVGTHFFDAIGGADNRAGQVMDDAATRLVDDPDVQSLEAQVGEIRDAGTVTEDAVRRTARVADILAEVGLTDKIDGSMVRDVERTARSATQFLPLLGSAANLYESATAVRERATSENRQKFLTSALAFGLEVALWKTGAPFQMAWIGTRFIANKTFLRFARHGCASCIALSMSELHWAIRELPYAVVESTTVSFVVDKLDELAEFATELAYDVDIDLSWSDVEALLESEEDIREDVVTKHAEGGEEDSLWPDIDLPDLEELFSDLLDGVFQ
jgi:hypothetical protein